MHLLRNLQQNSVQNSVQNSLQTEVIIMQMKHQPIAFHAKGFFPINYGTMLHVRTMKESDGILSLFIFL